MRPVLRCGFLLLAVVICGASVGVAQGMRFASAPVISVTSYGGYGLPIFPAPVYAYQPPSYWWVSSYPIEDPRQAGYNPSSGYEWDSVGALILKTCPANARVTLNGTFVGNADHLGPFQLPAGRHTIRLTADGFEPSEHIVNVEHSGPLFLDVHLRTAIPPEPGPKPAGKP